MVQVHDFWDVNTRTKPYERITTFEKPTEGGGEGGGGVERLTWSHGTGQDVILWGLRLLGVSLLLDAWTVEARQSCDARIWVVLSSYCAFLGAFCASPCVSSRILMRVEMHMGDPGPSPFALFPKPVCVFATGDAGCDQLDGRQRFNSVPRQEELCNSGLMVWQCLSSVSRRQTFNLWDWLKWLSLIWSLVSDVW